MASDQSPRTELANSKEQVRRRQRAELAVVRVQPITDLSTLDPAFVERIRATGRRLLEAWTRPEESRVSLAVSIRPLPALRFPEVARSVAVTGTGPM